MESKLPPGYSIHSNNDGLLQPWYEGKPLIPDMWWESHQAYYAERECYEDYAERTATHLEETKQKYRELYQASGWSDYLRQALDGLNDGVYCLQELVCILLSYREDCLHNAQVSTGRERHMQRQIAATKQRQLAIVVAMLQELHVEIPRNQTWPE